MSEKRNLNRLSHAEYARAATWLASKAVAFKTAKTSVKQISELGTKELGFGLSDSSVRRMIKEMRIDIPIEKHSPLSHMATRLARVEKLVSKLYSVIGEPLPE